MKRIHWLQTGPLTKRTGGFIYNRRIVTGLLERGLPVDLHCLPESFPAPDADARAQAVGLLARLPDKALLVIDGLAFGVLAEELAPHADRLSLVALCHHPLALETGLSEQQACALQASEMAALRLADAVVTTSHTTVENLRNYEVPAGIPINAVLPGVDIAPIAAGSGGDGMHILCVASLTARKGHGVLIEALAGLPGHDWRLTCAGGAQHEPETARLIAQQIDEAGLGERVRLSGELAEGGLNMLYNKADLFVLPSFHEGYGMVLAEALARGLPIISTTGGAIPEVVPKDAGILVPPGDAGALREALARLMDAPEERMRLAEGAKAARSALRPWSASVDEFAQILEPF